MEGERGEALEQRYAPDRQPPGKLVAWLVVLGFFMPVNLAVVCVLAGALGVAAQEMLIENIMGGERVQHGSASSLLASG